MKTAKLIKFLKNIILNLGDSDHQGMNKIYSENRSQSNILNLTRAFLPYTLFSIFTILLLVGIRFQLL